MGFINYKGENEDRYDELVEYSRALQDEEWKKAELERIYEWLEELTGDGRYAHLNVQEMLKLIIGQYRKFCSGYRDLIAKGKVPEKCDPERLLKDVSIDIATRHIQAFHTTTDVRNKHLQAFIERIFKLEDTVRAEQHFEYLASRSDYRKYFTECFDPTWTGRQFFLLLQYIDKSKQADEFFDEYKKLTLFVSLYLYQAFRPRDYGWMHQIEAERIAIEEIKHQLSRHFHLGLKLGLLLNPLYYQPEENQEEYIEPLEGRKPEQEAVTASEITPVEEPAGEKQEPVEPSNPRLDKDRFNNLINAGGIPNYVSACKMLVECKLPAEINENYNMLIERMPVLQDSIVRFDDVYQVDMDLFDEYFAPEALRVTATYLDYEAVAPSESILAATRENVLQASKKLLLVVNEKIDEIYRFVTIETNAEAKALEAIASQYGYVESDFKI